MTDRLSLKESFDRAAEEAKADPPWLKAIYEQNRLISQWLVCMREHPNHCRCSK